MPVPKPELIILEMVNAQRIRLSRSVRGRQYTRLAATSVAASVLGVSRFYPKSIKWWSKCRDCNQ